MVHVVQAIRGASRSTAGRAGSSSGVTLFIKVLTEPPQLPDSGHYISDGVNARVPCVW